MEAHDPLTRTVDAEEVKRSWPHTLKAVARKRERIVIEEDGVAVAAIVPLRDLQRLAKLDAEREERFKIFERIAAAFADEDPEEFERQADLALAEVREEMRRERAEERQHERVAQSEA